MTYRYFKDSFGDAGANHIPRQTARYFYLDKYCVIEVDSPDVNWLNLGLEEISSAAASILTGGVFPTPVNTNVLPIG